MEIEKIIDEASLAAWLQRQPREVSVTIAHRAAMRVLPMFWLWVNQQDDSNLTALVVLRPNLISGVACWRTNAEITVVVDAAFDDAFDAALVSPEAPYEEAMAACAAGAAAYTASAAVAVNVTLVAEDAASAADNAAALGRVLWREVQRDCRVLIKGNPFWPRALWQGLENPVSGCWDSVKNNLGKDWAFWRDWYQDALDGVEPNWEMLEEIALIDPKIWEQGPDMVNQLIAEIASADIARAAVAD